MIKHILTLLLMTSSCQAFPYVWAKFDKTNNILTFGERFSGTAGASPDRTLPFPWEPTNIRIDQNYDIAYVTIQNRDFNDSILAPKGTLHVYDLSEGKVIHKFILVNARAPIDINPKAIQVGNQYFKRYASKRSMKSDLLNGKIWYLFTEYAFANKEFSLMNFLGADPEGASVLDAFINETELNILVDSFYHYREDTDPAKANALFYKALQACNPYARAIMYLAFKHGLWCMPKSEILANQYKEGADQKSIELGEENLVLLTTSIALGVGIID